MELNERRSQYIKLLDGTQTNISTWDNVNRDVKLIGLGRAFYSKAVDRYTVLWPVRIQLTRVNGSLFERGDFMPSTAIENSGAQEPIRD